VLATLCMPEEGAAGERLLRSQFELGRLEWADGSIEFHLAHGEWIRMLRANGFEVEALAELRAPAGARDHPYYDTVTADWAKRWPSEEIWKARKR